jgi:hypothetical protein
VIHANTPATYKFKYLDAGWSQTTDFKVRDTGGGSVQAYFQANLDQGEIHGLGLWYGFNLLKYVSVNRGACTTPQFGEHCAISSAQLRAVADAIRAIGSGKGCGVSGWYLESAAGAERNYFHSSAMTSALQYLWNQTAGGSPAIQPGPCNIRGDLPAP